MGGSFGGYASLQSSILAPDLFISGGRRGGRL